jgi:hypothetical protein
MTAELYGRDAPNAVEFVIAWLAPLGEVSTERPAGEDLPYRMVTRVAGTDDGYSVDYPIISIHTFDADYTSASDAADMTHRRMLLLIDDPHNDVTLSDATVCNAEYVECVQRPTRIDVADAAVERFVARYQLGLSFVAVT